MGALRAAVGVADALREQYNDQLRELRASGLADEREAGPLRDALRALRDQPRPADGAVEVRHRSGSHMRVDVPWRPSADTGTHAQSCQCGLIKITVFGRAVSCVQHMAGVLRAKLSFSGARAGRAVMLVAAGGGGMHGQFKQRGVLAHDSLCRQVPDLAAMQRLQELRLEEGLAGVVKAGFKGLSMLCARV